MSAVRHVVFLVLPGFQSLDLAGPFDALAGANQLLDATGDARPRYRLQVVSPSDTVLSEQGLSIGTEPLDAVPDAIHTLLVPGGRGVQDAAGDATTVALVRDLAARATRVATVCTGAFVAAAAGLADGRTVTTHWARAEELRAQHPLVDVDDDAIGCVDGPLWSSAGVSAGIDLALAMVEHDLSADVAQTVARHLVVYARRPGGQSQFATPVWTDRAATSPIRDAQDAVTADPAADHSVAALARRVAMSERHFARRFTAEVGVSPGQYVQRVRAERARTLLETSHEGLELIAVASGLGTAESLRRVFHRRFGTSPQAYRRRFTRLDNPSIHQIPSTHQSPGADR